MNEKVVKEFQEFGSRMQMIAILTILGFVFNFLFIVEIVFIFLDLGNIRRIYYDTPDPHLMEFRSKYVLSFVFCIFGTIVIVIGAIAAVMPLIFTNEEPVVMGALIGIIIAVIIGIVFIVIGQILEYKAWGRLLKYLEANKDQFPEMVSRDAISGVRQIRMGTIFNLTIVLMIIGVILKIIGYFHLASLRNIRAYQYQPQPVVQVQPPYQPPLPPIKHKTPGEINTYCSQCGTKIDRDVKFCYYCGSRINSVQSVT